MWEYLGAGHLGEGRKRGWYLRVEELMKPKLAVHYSGQDVVGAPG